MAEIHAARPFAEPRRPSLWGDRLFQGITTGLASLILVLTAAVSWQLWHFSALSRQKFGFSFLGGRVWDPVAGIFGSLPFLYGTLLSSLVAMVIAVPIGVGAALFLSELAPRRLSDPLAFLTELLAAVPSVIYGLIGVFVLIPWVRETAEPWLAAHFGFLPLFQGAFYGVGMLSAGILLAVMIAPFIITISREIFLTVPQTLRESALALGATGWEVVKLVVLPYARSGVLGAIFLALARALGETMAVTMVIGNSPIISASLFSPGYTMASVLANEFTEATEDLYLHALIEVALVLFVVTLIINGVAHWLVYRTARSGKGHA